MLIKRIIPCLDVKEGRVVKGVQFVNFKDAGDPVEMAGFYDQSGADELVFLDITASHEKRKTMIEVVSRSSKEVNIPFTVGGGINNIQDMKDILSAGADKVTLNTAAVQNPSLIGEGAEKFGTSCIVAAIDARMNQEKGDWEVYINGGRTNTGRSALEWAEEVERLGAGEILLTSMDCDGEKDGYDLLLTSAVAERVKIPVIASGGAGAIEHFLDVFTKGRAGAALAASVFHYRQFSVREVKEYLAKHGVKVRL